MSEVKTSPLLGTDANGDPTYTFTSAHTFGDVARWIASEGGAEDVAFMLSEAALTRANAATAAAYEVAAREVECGCGAGPCQDTTNCSAEDAAAIRALATPDQTAALDKLIAEAVKPYMEANGILEDALQEVGDDYPGSNCQSWCQQQVKEARAILAASKKGGV